MLISIFIYQYDEYRIDFAVLILWREKSAKHKEKKYKIIEKKR